MHTAVALIDEDAMARGWVRSALEATEFTLVIEQATLDGLSPSSFAHSDVLLSEYRFSHGTGLDLVRTLRAVGGTVPAVILSAVPRRGLNEAARAAGAQGTHVKTASARELLALLRAVVSGGSAFDPRHPPRTVGQGALSRRERDVIRLVAGGATNDEVAVALGVGRETVKTLLSRVFRKLGVSSRTEAVSAAYRHHLL
jgi:DNA-binding NarL/FixJ family response regulator